MVARYAVPPSSSEHSHLSPLFSHQHLALTPLAATLMKFPASVANKGLMDELNPLDATLTKKRGGRVHFILLRIVRAARAKRLKSFRFMQLRTLLHSPKTNSFVFKQFRTLSQKHQGVGCPSARCSPQPAFDPTYLALQILLFQSTLSFPP